MSQIKTNDVMVDGYEISFYKNFSDARRNMFEMKSKTGNSYKTVKTERGYLIHDLTGSKYFDYFGNINERVVALLF